MLVFRRLTFLFSAIAVLMTMTAAEAVPTGVNLHNGYIEVVDRVHWNNVKDGSWPLVLRTAIAEVSSATVHENGVAYLNHCCIAAGTQYLFIVKGGRFGWHQLEVVPRLCN